MRNSETKSANKYFLFYKCRPKIIYFEGFKAIPKILGS